jgi:hypothetical protein
MGRDHHAASDHHGGHRDAGQITVVNHIFNSDSPGRPRQKKEIKFYVQKNAIKF